MKALILAIILALLPYQISYMPNQMKPKCSVCGHKADVSFCVKHYELELSKNIKETKTLFNSTKKMHKDLCDIHKKVFSEDEQTLEPIA